MPVWKYFTLCRENEAVWVLRTCCVLVFTLSLTGCVAGPTPHPADSDPTAEPSDLAGGQSEADENNSGGLSDASTSNDVLSSYQDTIGDDSDVGPDAGDTASDVGDTASGVGDTASDVGDTASDVDDTASDSGGQDT